MEPTLRASAPLVAALIALTLTLAGRASAQSEAELEEARAQFAEGVSLTEQERWSEAAERFRAVLRVRDAAQVRLNLALALEHSGELAEAVELLQTVVDDRSLDRGTRRSARRLLEATEPRLGRLVIHLRGDSTDVTILLDGRELGREQFGVPIIVAPGDRHLSAQRSSAPVAQRTIHVAEGGEAEVTLEVAPAGLDPELLRAEGPQQVDSGGSVAEEPWFWLLLSGAVLLVGGAIAIGFAASAGGPEPLSGNLQPGFIEVRLP